MVNSFATEIEGNFGASIMEKSSTSTSHASLLETNPVFWDAHIQLLSIVPYQQVTRNWFAWCKIMHNCVYSIYVHNYIHSKNMGCIIVFSNILMYCSLFYDTCSAICYRRQGPYSKYNVGLIRLINNAVR